MSSPSSPPTRLKRRRRAAAAAALAVIGLGVALFDWNMLRGPISHVVSRQLDREFRIDGPLRVHPWSLRPSFSADRLWLAGAADGSVPQLAAVGRLGFSLDLPALFRGEWVLDAIELDGADIRLEEGPDGRGNWRLGHSSNTGAPAVRVGTIRIRDSVLRAQLPSRRTELTLRVASDEAGSTLRFTASGRWQGEALDISGSAGGLQGLLDGARPYSVDARGNIGATRFSVAGNAARLPDLDGLDVRFSLAGQSLAKLFPLTGVPLPATPPYRIAGHLVRSGQRWQFDELDGLVGASDLRGKLAVDRSHQPQRLEGLLRARRVDLADLSGFIGARSTSGQVVPPPPGKVLPSRPLGFEKIAAADVALDFAIDDIRNSGLPLEAAAGTLRIVDRQVSLAPLRLGLAKGKVEGRLDLDASRAPATARLDLRATRLHLRELMPGADSKAFTTGLLGGSARLALRGRSVAELLGNADGEVALAMTGGSTDRLLVRLANLDVANGLMTWLSGGQKEDIRCLIGEMVAKDGVLRPRTLVLDTVRTRVVGRGEISLRDEKLDLHLRSEPKDGSLLALRGPLYLGGTFASPVIRPEPIPLGTRLAGAVALGLISPPLALLPLIETGGATDTPCATLFARSAAKPPAP